MPQTADRVKETSTTTGTGSITVLGAVPQFQSFASAFGSSTVFVEYAIVGQTGTEWEVVRGIFNGTTGLTRNKVIASSNAGALVNFSSGTKDVFATISGETIDNVSGGLVLAQMMGYAMP
jgi:hypothetical protein